MKNKIKMKIHDNNNGKKVYSTEKSFNIFDVLILWKRGSPKFTLISSFS